MRARLEKTRLAGIKTRALTNQRVAFRATDGKLPQNITITMQLQTQMLHTKLQLQNMYFVNCKNIVARFGTLTIRRTNLKIRIFPKVNSASTRDLLHPASYLYLNIQRCSLSVFRTFSSQYCLRSHCNIRYHRHLSSMSSWGTKDVKASLP